MDLKNIQPKNKKVLSNNASKLKKLGRPFKKKPLISEAIRVGLTSDEKHQMEVQAADKELSLSVYVRNILKKHEYI
jgi:hypothetical protein